MSTAHRPTWDPAQAKDVKGGSRQYSVRDMAAHTKLKFRSVSQAKLRRRKHGIGSGRQKESLLCLLLRMALSMEEEGEDEEANKRRKLLQEALELDKDEEDEEDDDKSDDGASQKANGDAMEESEEEESEEEDDTDELLRELEKIKRERAEEKARQEREESAAKAAVREVEIATSNPLLNLAAALGQSPGVNTTVPGTFSVKRRWDDGEHEISSPFPSTFSFSLTITVDLIFKNQAINQKKDSSGQFVNDLLRTEFHKKFMSKFIKVSSSTRPMGSV
ncbi:Cwf15/Cwc15 cell cycle control protein-domain-containing protein [Pisolithus thermaeus]|nr:Cwf15/Cwc15 cell cycle control protein-domain-containing protein [Pisolithus thermaeus]